MSNLTSESMHLRSEKVQTLLPFTWQTILSYCFLESQHWLSSSILILRWPTLVIQNLLSDAPHYYISSDLVHTCNIRIRLNPTLCNIPWYDTLDLYNITSCLIESEIRLDLWAILPSFDCKHIKSFESILWFWASQSHTGQKIHYPAGNHHAIHL